MQYSVYHIFLRISALTTAIVLLFVSGVVVSGTKDLASNTQLYLANAIGIQAQVPANEVNTLSAELLKRDAEISQREIAVTLKESKQDTSDISTFILSVLLFVLLVLIILNYVLDFIRNRKVVIPSQQYEQVL